MQPFKRDMKSPLSERRLDSLRHQVRSHVISAEMFEKDSSRHLPKWPQRMTHFVYTVFQTQLWMLNSNELVLIWTYRSDMETQWALMTFMKHNPDLMVHSAKSQKQTSSVSLTELIARCVKWNLKNGRPLWSKQRSFYRSNNYSLELTIN